MKADEFFEYIKIFSNSYLDDNKFKLASSLILNNRDYKLSLLTEKMDNDKLFVYNLLNTNIKIFVNFMDEIKKLNDEDIKYISNHNNGELFKLIHKNLGNNKNLQNCLLFLFDYMEKDNLTFLDKDGDIPTIGLLNELVSNIKCKGYENLFEIVGKIKSNLNIKVDFTKQWIVSNGNNIGELIKTGASFKDSVIFNGVELTIWKYLTIKEINFSHFLNLDKNLTDEDIEEIEIFVNDFKSKSNQLNYLIPKDHRSKIGFVRNIINEKRLDQNNFPSVKYLINHRVDLYNLFIKEIKGDDLNILKKDLTNKNLYGFDLLTNSINQSNFYCYYNMYDKFGLDKSLKFNNDDGLISNFFRFYKFFNSNNKSYFSLSNIDKVISCYKNEIDFDATKFIFGDEKNQLKLLNNILRSNTPKSVENQKHLYVSILLLYDKYKQSLHNLNKELCFQIQLEKLICDLRGMKLQSNYKYNIGTEVSINFLSAKQKTDKISNILNMIDSGEYELNDLRMNKIKELIDLETNREQKNDFLNWVNKKNMLKALDEEITSKDAFHKKRKM